MKNYLILKVISLFIYVFSDVVYALLDEPNYYCLISYYIQYLIKPSFEIAYVFVISNITNCMLGISNILKSQCVKRTEKCQKEIIFLKINQFYSFPLLMTFANFFISMLFIFNILADMKSIESVLHFMTENYYFFIWSASLTIEALSISL